jgi:phosphoribosylcarboxyaminoimidazole (NCAIR) mutase
MSLPNDAKVILASAARTASVTGDWIGNAGHRGLHLIINVTAAAATPSVVFTIQGRDPVSGDPYDLLVSSAITGTGMTVLKIYPGIATAANAAASDVLPAQWRVKAVAADSDSLTYSIAAHRLA